MATTRRTDHGAELSGLDLQVQVTQGGVRLTGWGQKALVDAPQLDRRGGAGWAHGSERTVPAGGLAIVVATTRPCGHKSHSVHCVHETITPEASHEGLVIASGGSPCSFAVEGEERFPGGGPARFGPSARVAREKLRKKAGHRLVTASRCSFAVEGEKMIPWRGPPASGANRTGGHVAGERIVGG